MVGATADKDGKAGTVPAPKAGDQTKFLRADGTWATVNTDGVRECTAAEMNSWLDEVDNG